MGLLSAEHEYRRGTARRYAKPLNDVPFCVASLNMLQLQLDAQPPLIAERRLCSVHPPIERISSIPGAYDNMMRRQEILVTIVSAQSALRRWGGRCGSGHAHLLDHPLLA